MRNFRKAVWVFWGILTLYVVSYCFDSFCGGYWAKPEMDGRDKYSFGLAMPTAILWQPWVGHQALGNSDFLGSFYAPLIWLDRRYAHPTVHISDDGGLERAIHMSRAEIHPHFRAMYDKFHTNSQSGRRED